jgi:hypothetical protein
MKPKGTGRIRDNIPTKMGAQTQWRDSLTGEPRLARGADAVLLVTEAKWIGLLVKLKLTG